MATYTRDFSIPSDDVDDVHAFLQDIWGENPHIHIRERHILETAVIELTGNIIEYADVVSGVTCKIVIETSEDRVDVTVADNGELLELQLDEHVMPDAYAESGRGIPLIRTLVDEFTFETVGNKNLWRLSKRIPR